MNAALLSSVKIACNITWSDGATDAKVSDLIASGETSGTFQIESEGMKALAQQVKPSSLEHLSALVALCRAQGRPLIDCQQNTQHLAFMGAAEMPRAEFAAAVQQLVREPDAPWRFEPVYWNALMPHSPAER